MLYFKFIDQLAKSENIKHSLIEKIMTKLVTLIIPRANPDFEGKYRNVSLWYIEYSQEHNCVSREIGLDEKQKVIVKGPWKNNYGFWADSNAEMQDFNKWNIEDSTKDEFETLWEESL